MNEITCISPIDGKVFATRNTLSLKDAKDEVGIIHTNINLEELRKVRKAIPSLKSKQDYSTNF